MSNITWNDRLLYLDGRKHKAQNPLPILNLLEEKYLALLMLYECVTTVSNTD
jgi:hypothetical protein